MAFELHRHGFQQALKAASQLLPRTTVRLAGSNALFVLPCASWNQRPFGVTANATHGASGLASDDAVTVYEEGNVVKAVAAASLGVGVEVAVGSTNGRLVPLAAASGTPAWAVGISESPAGDGEVFSLYVKPRQTGGLA
jgi:hypothetical protein